MMTLYRSAIFSLGLLAITAGACAQTSTVADTPKASQPEVSFQFERPGLAVPRFTLLIREDGTGFYKAEEAPVTGGGAALSPTAGKHVDRTLTVSSSTAATIFKAARSLDHFNIDCASKAKNIADTGKKTLSYSGADGRGSCTYNYSENKNVASLAETFQAIAFTLDEGRRLDFLHRYDRLGLDAEMETLTHEHEAKRALELGTISTTLTALANDDALMKRVRSRAVKLLDQASTDK
jgi:hypothetical protein